MFQEQHYMLGVVGTHFSSLTLLGLMGEQMFLETK
jgi:hypothetical protein